MALGLCGCASMQQPYLDDAYYYPDKNAPAAPAVTAESGSTSATSSQSGPSMEILSAQDTTITVRIKR